MSVEVRKYVTVIEEVLSEGGKELARPVRMAAAIAVVKNPFAGTYQEDLSLLSGEYSSELGPRLAKMAADALGTEVLSFGKAALVGTDGEVAHGSNLIHTRLFGDALRDLCPGEAVVTAAEKCGPAGASLALSLRGVMDVGPLGDGVDVTYMWSWEVRVPDAPRPDEILVIAVVADGPRPDARNVKA